MSELPILRTERLELRPFSLADASQVQLLAGHRKVADTTLNIPHPYRDGMAEEWIGTHARNWEAGSDLTLAITTQEEDTLVGAISLIDISWKHQGELGYWIGVPYWGRGYATEAAKALVQYAFEELGLARVHAHCFSRNLASARVLEKVGMQPEGVLRKHVKKWDQLEDVRLFGVLAGE